MNYLLSSHKANVFGTGTPAEPRAFITLKSDRVPKKCALKSQDSYSHEKSCSEIHTFQLVIKHSRFDQIGTH